MIAALSRLLAGLPRPEPVSDEIDPFDPDRHRDRQRWAAVAAAFSPHTPAARRHSTNQEGFQ